MKPATEPLHEKYPALTFSDAAWAWFVQACEEMEITVSPKKRAQVEALYSHLLHVNARMNLTRITEPMDYLKFHLLDSLTVLPDVEKLTRAGHICIDLGSGGGYPGLPLILWLPDRKWVLVDSRQKKVTFLTDAIKLTGCANASARAFRGREAQAAAPDLAGRCAVVLARAVGRAAKLMLEAAPLLKRGGHLIALKGPSYDREERRETARTCGDLGYEQVDELAIRHEEGDPERLIIILAKN